MRPLAVMALALLGPGAAWAACPGQTQLELNECAAAEYKRADAALNAAWGPATAFMDGIGQGAVLLDAQRKWIAFRDAACAAETAPYEGGSILPLIHWTCMSRLTSQRTEDLLLLSSY